MANEIPPNLTVVDYIAIQIFTARLSDGEMMVRMTEDADKRGEGLLQYATLLSYEYARAFLAAREKLIREGKIR